MKEFRYVIKDAIAMGMKEIAITDHSYLGYNHIRKGDLQKMRQEIENRPEFPPAIEPEAALYDGFLNDSDRAKVIKVRNTEPAKLADYHPEFIDERLPELLLHYKGRNYPDTLSEDEAIKYEQYRHSRLERLAPKFMKELEQIYQNDEYVGEELKLYFESLFDSEY